MTNVPNTGSDDYTHQAHLAVLVAARTEHDFAGWLAGSPYSPGRRRSLDPRTP